MEVFLEILKLTLPSFAVVAVVYFMLREYFESEHKRAMMELQFKHANTTLPIKIGAYERLSMFCERISIPALILRVRANDTNAAQLRMALMIAIQQEFEHNITQQVYVSDNLWKIIKIARDDVQNTINHIYQTIDPDVDAKIFAQALFDYLNTKDVLPLHKALEAVKKEASLILQ